MTANLVKNKAWADAGRLAADMGEFAPKFRTEARRRMKSEVLDPIVVDVKRAGRSSDRQSGRAAGTVKSSVAANMKISGGGRGAYGAFFMGSEFGGGLGKPRPRTRIVTTPHQGTYKRRTTMQFRRHRKTGYWFVPTIMKSVDEAGQKLLDIGTETFWEAVR